MTTQYQKSWVYSGKYKLTDAVEGSPVNAGELQYHFLLTACSSHQAVVG